MPRPALFIVLLAGLVLTAFGFGLIAQAAPSAAGVQNPILAAIPTNTALDLGVYDCDQPADVPDHCRGITDYSGFVYDSTRHRFLMFGGGHATTFRDDLSVFSFATLKWSSAYPSTLCTDMTLANMDRSRNRWTNTGNPFSRHTYDMTAYAPNTDEFFLLSGPIGTGYCAPGIDPSTGSDPFYLTPRLSAYNLAGEAWNTETRIIPWDAFSGSEYDPISGKIILLSVYGLWVFDPVTRDMVQALGQFSDPLASRLGYANNLTYFPPNQRLYYLARGAPTRVFEVRLDREDWSASTVTERVTPPNAPNSEESGWVYDTRSQVIGGGVLDGLFHAYNPLSNTWTSRSIQIQSSAGVTSIGSQAFHAIGFDPVDEVFVFITRYADGQRVWAYRFDGPAPTPVPPPTFPPGLTERLYLPHIRR